MSTVEIIRQHINKIPLGEPFTSSSLLQFSSRANLDQVLCRLAKAGEITRVARGIFIRPEQIPFIGPVFPEPFKIAEAIAKATGESIAIHGAEAALRLQLTTQVPLKPLFYTTGTSRHIKVGKLEITLKHVSARKLVKPGTIVCLVISALWHLGKENVTIKVVEKILKKFKSDQTQALFEHIQYMPSWMADLFYQYRKELSA